MDSAIKVPDVGLLSLISSIFMCMKACTSSIADPTDERGKPYSFVNSLRFRLACLCLGLYFRHVFHKFARDLDIIVGANRYIQSYSAHLFDFPSSVLCVPVLRSRQK